MKTKEDEKDATNAKVSKPTQKEDVVMRTGRWQEDEKELFLKAHKQFGKQWKKIQKSFLWKKIQKKFLPWRTSESIRKYAASYFKRIGKSEAVRD